MRIIVQVLLLLVLGFQKFELHQLGSHWSVEARFWQWLQMTNAVKPKAFAANVHIQQDDRYDMQTKIFYYLVSVSFTFQGRWADGVYYIVELYRYIDHTRNRADY